jgi:hypothetical protein
MALRDGVAPRDGTFMATTRVYIGETTHVVVHCACVTIHDRGDGSAGCAWAADSVRRGRRPYAV